MIISYYNIINKYTEDKDKADFQIILYEKDNSIKFNYKEAKAAPDNLNFVGIENKTGSSGLRYMGLSSTQSNVNLSVRFYRGAVGPVDPDNDGDDYPASIDCDDYNAKINPGAAEICGDGIDNNCNGYIDEGCDVVDPDNDGDGYPASIDCNDYNAKINPGATEICGDGIDNDCDGYIDEGCEEDVVTPLQLFFPLLSAAAERTYFGLVNNSDTEHLVGSLLAYNITGTLLAEYDKVDLLPHEQHEFQLKEVFSKVSSEVAYVVFEAEPGSLIQGYCRLNDDSGVRVAAYPAAIARKDSREIDIPDLLYSSGWKTELAVLSLSKKPLKAIVEFNNGASATITAETSNKGGGLFKLEISEELKVTYDEDEVSLGEIDPVATAATVKFSTFIGNLDKNQDLALGAVLYRNDSTMSSALLHKAASDNLYVPYITVDSFWWTGLALYNPLSELRSSGVCTLAFTATSLDGLKLSSGQGISDLDLADGESHNMDAKSFAEGTHGLKIENECGVSGMEFMGSGSGMGCLSLTGNTSKAGVLVHLYPGIKDNKWSGIALLNPDAHDPATVILRAYNVKGDLLAEKTHTIASLKQLIGLPENFFDKDITGVASIRFVSDKEITGLVVNSFDFMVDDDYRTQVEILPVLPIEN